ncbi:serine hydrolase [Rapidithrix thailandica]|uniref:beta-lactamase n=1 Tax=Rapidithrix thailandica TaxID=413964 RepID=A0AAW9S277_9BACT
MKALLYFCLFFSGTVVAQNTKVPSYYQVNKALCKKIQDLVTELALDREFPVGEDGMEQISLAVIRIPQKGRPQIAGFRYENFIYPASVYKMYVAAEVLRQVYEGKYSLTSPYIVRSPNDVDKNKEIPFDPRPLLQDGDTVTINYLLDLMITRSDNSAANCLIDLVQRKPINALMHRYHWEGSEVTRKFLNRKFEDAEYQTIRGTETSALHAADFMYLLETRQLVNPWVSMQMKALLARQLDKSKLASGFPKEVLFSHKTGWFSTWTHDVGIVEDGQTTYILSCFLPLPEEEARPKLKALAKRIHAFMKG